MVLKSKHLVVGAVSLIFAIFAGVIVGWTISNWDEVRQSKNFALLLLSIIGVIILGIGFRNSTPRPRR